MSGVVKLGVMCSVIYLHIQYCRILCLLDIVDGTVIRLKWKSFGDNNVIDLTVPSRTIKHKKFRCDKTKDVTI